MLEPLFLSLWFVSPAPLTPAIVEFSKRPTAETKSKFNPHHVITPVNITLEQALGVSDVVISAVPVEDYKVPTRWLKDGCICVNVAGEKNFEADVRERVSLHKATRRRSRRVGVVLYCFPANTAHTQASIYVPSVGVMTICMLQRNLLRLCQYQDMVKEHYRAAAGN